MPSGDLDGMPISSDNNVDCAALCTANPNCTLFTFHTAGCSYDGETCRLPTGCCWLKAREVSGKAPTINNCTCSGYIRLPQSSFVPDKPAPAQAKNILYILVDDLRPDLEAYGQSAGTHHSPNIKRLADSGLVFDNAYCQISVCSPSRQSFLTGRRPDHAGIYNFIDHFRQADCGLTDGGVSYTGATYKSVSLTDDGACEWSSCGESGQCCLLCSEDSKCQAWTYNATDNQLCELKTVQGNLTPCPSCTSGPKGVFGTHAKWTTLPQHFKENGYLSLSTGKIFHTEEGGVHSQDPDLNGPGMPPNMDPVSWSEDLSMQMVNDVANMWPCVMGAESTCPVPATIAGMVDDPSKEHQLCDKVVGDDAIVKLRLASRNRDLTGQPFFLAVGFRKPHLAFRFPKPFLSLLPGVDQISLAAHRTLDASVPPYAHCDQPPQSSPYIPVDNATAQQWRLFYRAATAWMDYQVGRVLDELDTLGLSADTMVVFHSDHGWSLGEHGEWQKFTNFEHGTRVPLIMRVPWLPQSLGKRVAVLAELVDIFPTMLDAVNVPLLNKKEVLDGVSLLPVLLNPRDDNLARALKPYALSQYMRCPKDPSLPWKSNDCLFVDRSKINVMGYTIRTHEWRYTEWAQWNGEKLRIDWEKALGNELYSHTDDDGFSFDLFENTNQNESFPDVVRNLSFLLRTVVANQTRLH